MQIGRFDVREELGRGGMGAVFAAEDRESGRMVALKTLQVSEPRALYRFKREFRAMQELQHPNLVRLGELGHDQGRWFFTMELVQGVDLLGFVTGTPRTAAPSPSADTLQAEALCRSLATHGHRFDADRLRHVLRQLVDALSAVHAAGMVHRDITPSNILVTADERVVLLDFGLIAELRDDRRSVEHNILGTAAYMAPEQARAGEVGPASDWYSVGVVLYEAMTGRLPHAGTNLELLFAKQLAPHAPVLDVAPNAPRDLAELCDRLLAADPLHRPSSDEIRRRLGVRQRRREDSGRHLRPDAPFVGREHELAALDAVHARCRTERAPLVAIVEGESGIGKTELCRRFRHRAIAADPNAVILAGRCYERESVPFKAVDGVVDALTRYLMSLPTEQATAVLPRRADLLALLFPVLARVPSIGTAPRPGLALPPAEQRAAAFVALRELFQRLCDRRSVIVIIDDLQWADRDSMGLLSRLLAPNDAPALTLIATARPGVGADIQAVTREFEHKRIECRVLELAAIPPERGLELVRALAPDRCEAEPRWAAQLVAEAGGHPLFIEALVHHTMSGSDHGRTLDDALGERFVALPRNARAVLVALAVAGAPVRQAVIAGATQLGSDAFDIAAAQLRARHLARISGARGSDTIEIYHDRVRLAVLRRLDDDRHCRWHGRIAEALESAGPTDAELPSLISHLERAGDARRAGELSVRAADIAMVSLGFERAARHYRDALRLADYAPEQRTGVRAKLAEALSACGDGTAAADAFMAAAQEAQPHVALAFRQRAAAQLLTAGHIERGVAALSELMTEIGLPPPTHSRSLARYAWHRLRLAARGLSWQPRSEEQIAPVELMKLDCNLAASETLSMVDPVLAATYQTRSLLRALQLGEPIRIGRALVYESGHLASQGGRRRLARAERVVAHAEAIAADLKDPTLESWSAISRGVLHYFRGEFSDAESRFFAAERALSITRRTNMDVNSVRTFRLFCLKFLGEVGRSRALREDCLRAAVAHRDLYAETTLRLLTMFHHCAAGHPEAVEEDLAQSRWVPPEGSFHLQHWYELEVRGETALYQGTGADALTALAPMFHQLDRSLVSRIQIVRIVSWWLRGRLLLSASADISKARRPVLRLTRKLDRERLPLARLFAELLRSGVAERANDSDRTRAHLQASLSLATRLQMKLITAAIQTRLAPLEPATAAALHQEDAAAWCEREQIADPARMFRIALP